MSGRNSVRASIEVGALKPSAEYGLGWFLTQGPWVTERFPD